MSNLSALWSCWFFLAQAIFKGKMISLYDEHSLKSTFRCKQIHFFSAAELWTVKTATSNYWTSSLTWTGERPIHLLKAYNVTAPLFSSPSVLSSSLWGCVSMQLLLLSCLPFPHHPLIHSSLRLCHCLLIERFYIYYSFDWLALICSQVAEINHSRNPVICIVFGGFLWQRSENFPTVEFRGTSWKRCKPKRERLSKAGRDTLLTAKKSMRLDIWH